MMGSTEVRVQCQVPRGGSMQGAVGWGQGLLWEVGEGEKSAERESKGQMLQQSFEERQVIHHTL